jgi:hypothetical protein
MSRILWVSVVVLWICGASHSEARQLTSTSSDFVSGGANQPVDLTAQLTQRPDWDVTLTAGLFQSKPDGADGPYGDDWYLTGRYAASAGRFWTPHLKTEVEFATTGQGSRYTNRPANVPGVPAYYPLNVHETFRLHQISGRVVWQFLENTWVHPYVFGGITADAQHHSTYIPDQYYYPTNDPRTPGNRILVTPEVDESGIDYSAGATAGIGTKVYVSSKSYFNAGFVVSRAKPSTTVSFIAGFGVDF